MVGMADLKRRVIFDVDSQSANASVKALEAIRKEGEKEVKTNEAIAQSAEAAGLAIIGVFDEVKTDTKVVIDLNYKVADSAETAGLELIGMFDNAEEARKNASKGQARFKKEIEDTGVAVSELDARLAGLDADKSRINRNVGFAGDVQSNLGALTSLTGSALGGSAGSAVGNVGQVIALGEELPRLKASFGALVPSLAAANKEVGLGGLATALQGLVPSLSATSAGALVFGTAMAGIAVAFVAVGAVVASVQNTIEEARKSEEAYLDVLLSSNQAKRDAKALAEAGDVAGLLAERDRLRTQEQAQIEDIASVEAELNRLQAQKSYLSSLGEVSLTLDASIGEVTATMEELDGQVFDTIIGLNAVDAALSGVSEVEIARATNVEALAQVEADVSETEGERARLEQERLGILTRMNALEEQRSDLLNRQAQTEERANEDLALTQRFANEDELAEEVAFYADLEKIRADGKVNLAKIDASLADLAVERQQKEMEIADKAIKARSKLNADYFKDERKALADFAEKEQQIDGKNKKERLRALEDLGESLADAERDNNVVAFLQAQRDGETRLTRLAEDADAETKQRSDDFAKQREEARQALAERTAEIKTALDEERGQVKKAYDERRAKLTESIDTEKQAIVERILAMKARYNAEEAREDHADARQAERDALRDARAEEDFQAQLTRLDALKNAEQLRLNAVDFGLQRLSLTIRGLEANINRLSGGGGSTTTPPATGGGGFKGPGWGLFDLINNATGRFLGGGASTSSVSSGGGGFTYAPQINATVGDVASQSMVETALRNYAELDARTWADTFGGMMNPS